MTKTRKIQMLLIAIVLCVSCFLTCFIPTTIQSVYASSIGVVGGYTNVMDDLEKDTNFDANDYPVKENDYSLQVIQIAESSDNELFVYVYQPNENHGKYTASTINISASLHNALNIKNYKLTLLNYDGVFQKYVVNGLICADGTTRYYDVVSIFRVFDETIDAGLEDGNENTIDEVVYKVAKQYTIGEINGETVISVADTDVVEITDKYVGFVRYEDGFTLYGDNACDSHFVAFSTDREIDKLYEADVYYTSQLYEFSYASYIGSPGEQESYGEIKENYAYLNYTQQSSYTGGGLWASTYTWERIQTPEQFFASVNQTDVYSVGVFNVKTQSQITEEGKQDIEDKDWVLRFAETAYNDVSNMSATLHDHTIVGDVTILRLKFETDGVVYNLGVVDNKQTGDGNPDNYTKWSIELSDAFKVILGLLLLIVLCIVLAPILPTIFNILWWLIKTIIKIVWWLLCLPFKLIKAIFKKRE